MPTPLRWLRAAYSAVLVTAGLTLAGCTGASPGQPPNAGDIDKTAGNTADSVTPVLITYGKPIAVLIVIIVAVGVAQWLWHSPAVKLIGACALVGWIVWTVAKK